MPLANTSCRVDYDGNDVATDFATTFAFLEPAHLVVELSEDDGATWVTKTLDDDYDVAGDGDPEPGGTVTMHTAPATGETLRIERRTPITQQSDLQTSGSLPVKTLIAAFDKLTMICQELARDLADALAGVVGSTYAAIRVTDTFTVLNPLESTFPRVVAVGAAPVTAQIGRIQNNTDPTEVLDQPPSLAWSPSGNSISVKRINGLTVGDSYTVTFEVRT